MNSLPFLHKFSDTSNSVSNIPFNESLSTTTTKILNQFISWRKSRRVKSVLKNTNSLGNICVIMKSEQSTRVFNQNHQNSFTECFHSQTSFTPAVSFINSGEGLVSMQLMDRIMINDNQLYSMDLSDHQISSNYNRSPETPSHYRTNNCLIKYNIEDKNWFYGSIERQKAIEILNDCPIGSFVIRYSMTEQNCFAMTLRVPNDYHLSGIAHYLILLTERQTLKIKGFTKEFKTLESLVIHHSIMKERLPCLLLLPNTKLINNRLNTKSISNFSLDNDLENNINEFEDILVDVDSDPNYQKILINFRKTMSQLS